MKRQIVLSLLGLFGIAGPAVAGSHGYQCLISEEVHLSASGSMKAYPKPLSLGKRFAVDRDTGLIVEPDSATWSLSSDTTVTVLARGNRDNSFIATYVGSAAGGGVHLTVVRVEEFAPKVRKPFVVTSGGSVYSGLCE